MAIADTIDVTIAVVLVVGHCSCANGPQNRIGIANAVNVRPALAFFIQ
jgi:hypothetical protein